MSMTASATGLTDVLTFFRALADETRLAIVRLLALNDLQPGELGAQLRTSPAALAYHLKQLRDVQLLRGHQSTFDRRDIYYSVDLERLQALYALAGDALHTSRSPTLGERGTEPNLERPLRILFLCTHNRARSQLAEGLTRYLAGDQVEVFSGGSNPSELHPLTIEMLQDLGIDTSQLYPKSMDQFIGQSFDYIITTCDRVRGGCPTFPGDAQQIHWSFTDPSAVDDEDVQYAAFCTTRRELLTRIRYLLSLPHPVTGQQLKLHA